MTRDGSEIKICEWNIHHQGGRGSKTTTPDWVVDELKDQDIVVLTEFPTDTRSASSKSRSSIIGGLKDSGFVCSPSDNRRGNDVLIAVKKSLITEPELEFYCPNPYYNEDELIPENAFVQLKIKGRDLVVVGVRIRTLGQDYKGRKAQFNWLMEKLEQIGNHPVLLAGDWNHGRVCSSNEDWSIGVMMDCLEEACYSVFPKTGSSCLAEPPRCRFPNDHFVINRAQLRLENVQYDWEFVDAHASAYKWASGDSDAPRLAKVSPPYPDHAMLKATLSFTN